MTTARDRSVRRCPGGSTFATQRPHPTSARWSYAAFGARREQLRMSHGPRPVPTLFQPCRRAHTAGHPQMPPASPAVPKASHAGPTGDRKHPPLRIRGPGAVQQALLMPGPGESSTSAHLPSPRTPRLFRRSLDHLDTLWPGSRNRNSSYRTRGASPRSAETLLAAGSRSHSAALIRTCRYPTSSPSAPVGATSIVL